MTNHQTESLNSLLDVALSYACDKLEKNKTLYPFLYVIDKENNLKQANELTEQEKEIPIDELIESFKITLKEKKDYFGFAFGLGVKVNRFKNEGFVKAIEVHIEHRDLQQAHFCYLPYQMIEGKIQYGQLFAQQKLKEIL